MITINGVYEDEAWRYLDAELLLFSLYMNHQWYGFATGLTNLPEEQEFWNLRYRREIYKKMDSLTYTAIGTLDYETIVEPTIVMISEILKDDEEL